MQANGDRWIVKCREREKFYWNKILPRSFKSVIRASEMCFIFDLLMRVYLQLNLNVYTTHIYRGYDNYSLSTAMLEGR